MVPGGAPSRPMVMALPDCVAINRTGTMSHTVVLPDTHMIVPKLASIEQDTHASYQSSGFLTVDTSKYGIEVYRFRKSYDTYCYPGASGRKSIVLHFLAGYLNGISWLTREDYHVSVPFVIGRNGNIYELFDPDESWAYHLGNGTVGGNETMSRQTIGIELANVGQLKPKEDKLYFVTTKTSGGHTMTVWTPYCLRSETQHFDEVDYRGESFFATYTDPQYEATRRLLAALCDKYAIPKRFLPLTKRYGVFESGTAAANFKGIASHVNYRPSGKWDIGPGFEWAKISLS